MVRSALRALPALLLLTLVLVGPVNADSTGYTQHKTIAAPGGIVVGGGAGATRNYCHDIDPTLAFSCDNSGGASGFGGARFDTSSDGAGASTIAVLIVAEFSSGTMAPGAEGFGIVVGNDRNDDGPIDSFSDHDNDGEADDHYGIAYSNGGIAGDICTEQKVNCSDPTTVSMEFCVHPDLDGAFDEIAVTVFWWADESFVFNEGTGQPGVGDRTGAGIAVGMFDIYYRVTVIDAPGCADNPGKAVPGSFC